jgi:hypothetical protein
VNAEDRKFVEQMKRCPDPGDPEGTVLRLISIIEAQEREIEKLKEHISIGDFLDDVIEEI